MYIKIKLKYKVEFSNIYKNLNENFLLDFRI